MTQLVPYISTAAGACLTYDNWYELGITTAVYELSTLLMKPGLAYLQTLSALRDFLGWTKALVLDASHITFNAQRQWVMKSPYDGTRCTLEERDVWRLLDSLQPTGVVLPKDSGFSEQLIANFGGIVFQESQTTRLTAANSQRGMYTTVDNYRAEGQLAMPWYIHDTLAQSEYLKPSPLNWQTWRTSREDQYLASNRPALDAYHGWVYVEDTAISIADKRFAHHFQPMQPGCTCPTCQQQLTCAYLHHLYHSTPLLCQRLLIMHNVHVVQELLR